MNHKVLFILSIVVIVVGIGGIFFQNTQHQPAEKEKPDAVAVLPSEQDILVAEARRDLKPYDILTADDYRLVSLKVSSTMKDHRDISSLSNGNIQGALLRSHVANGTTLIPADLVASNDPDFLSSSLREGEFPYSIPVFPRDDYMLSVTHSGDKMDVFIRMVEVERNKKSDVGLVHEGSPMTAKSTPQYVTTRLLHNITVLESKRFDKNQHESEANHFPRDKETPVGRITLRLNQKQVIELITVAKAGEIFLITEGATLSANSRVRMDDILPQFRTVKELRGR